MKPSVDLQTRLHSIRRSTNIKCTKLTLQFENSVSKIHYIFDQSLCVQTWWENVVCFRIFLLRGNQGGKNKKIQKRSCSDAVTRRSSHWVATLHLQYVFLSWSYCVNIQFVPMQCTVYVSVDVFECILFHLQCSCSFHIQNHFTVCVWQQFDVIDCHRGVWSLILHISHSKHSAYRTFTAAFGSFTQTFMQ